jgi:hypothetical protein
VGEVSMSDGERFRPVNLLLDLRDVKAWVESRTAGESREYVLVLTDGYARVELTGGLAGRNEAAVFGAQRIATAALDYAAGLAMFDLPDDPGTGAGPGATDA